MQCVGDQLEAFSVKYSDVCSNHQAIKMKTSLAYKEGILSYRAVNTLPLLYKPVS